ncbi:MAG: EAL domain-containing protein [Gammaproteobacteria bacterium]|nr:EAL domain-containing protein [Gammaproteobacteria bacterium]
MQNTLTWIQSGLSEKSQIILLSLASIFLLSVNPLEFTSLAVSLAWVNLSLLFIFLLALWRFHAINKYHFLSYVAMGYIFVLALMLATLSGISITPTMQHGDDGHRSLLWLTHLLESTVILFAIWAYRWRLPLLAYGGAYLLIGAAGLMLAMADYLPEYGEHFASFAGFYFGWHSINTGLLLAAIISLYSQLHRLARITYWYVMLAVLFALAAELLLTPFALESAYMHYLSLVLKFFTYNFLLLALRGWLSDKSISISAESDNIYDAIPFSILLVDENGLIEDANKTAQHEAKAGKQILMGKNCHSVFHPSIEIDLCPVCQNLADRLPVMNLEVKDEAKVSWKSYTLTPMHFADGRLGMIHFHSDISDRREAEEALLQESNFDQLTKLANRRLATDRLEQAVKRADLNDEHLLCLFIDLDHFKHINDTLGHEYGDKVLVHVVKILQQSCRDIDSLARWGGDEFLLMVPKFQGLKKAEALAGKLLRSVASPCVIEGKEIMLRCSIGMSIYPEHGITAENLLSYADSALHKAKQAGRNTYRFYDARMNADVERRLELEMRLAYAVDHDEFELQYQPKIDIAKHEVIGMEALLRWNNAELGVVAAAEFIPLAEESGQIVEIGKWLIQRCQRDLLRMKQEGLHDLRLAMNVSSRQLQEDDFVELLCSSFVVNGLSPSDIELEITEGLLMDVSETNISKLLLLKKAGFTLALDDFGTGYAAISYLKNFPFSEIKIDRSYIRDIETDEADARLCAAIIAMAAQLDLNIVAEGVETEGQVEYLYEHGAHIIQGNYYSRPLDYDDFLHYVRKYL